MLFYIFFFVGVIGFFLLFVVSLLHVLVIYNLLLARQHFKDYRSST